MNRIFSKVWSKALGRLVVASELASRKRAGSNGSASVSVGPVSHNLLGVAVTVALLGLPIEALAGNGIHINSGSDGECVSINEPGWDPIRRTQTELLNSNINFRDGDVKCRFLQNTPDGVLFYRPPAESGVGATSLSMSGDLVVGGTLFLNPAGRTSIDVQALQMGRNAKALGKFDWAVGSGAEADGDNKVDPDNGSTGTAYAFGNNAKALYSNAMAVGTAAVASGARSTAVGAAARAVGHFSTAIGRFAQATGNSAIALGRDTIARAEQSTAVGYGARTGNAANRAVAIGANTQANGQDSLAMGSGAMVSADMTNAIAIGKDSRGNAADAVALGVGAVSEHFNSVAIGTSARTSPHRAVAPAVLNGTRYSFLPEGLATANVNGVVSVGSAAASRQIINVAPGVLDATSYDAVNGSQLFAAYQEINKLGEKHAALTTKDAELEDRLNKLPKPGAGVDGESLAAVIGPGTRVDANGRIALPELTLKSLRDAAPQPTSLLGAVGALDDEIVRLDNVLGMMARNALFWDSREGAFSADNGVANANRIANVADGVRSQDAVNVGQLQGVERAATEARAVGDTAQRAADAAQATANEAKAAAGSASTQLAGIGPQETVACRIQSAGQSVADALGGGASANADGTVSAPSYGVAAINADGSTGLVTQHGNVGSALTALDQNIGTVNDRVDGLARDSLRWNESLGAYDAAHDGQATSRIANVAAGVSTTDAVNVGQLNTVDQAAKAAQSTADGAASAANQAQATADSAVNAAASAAADAGNAQRTADGASRAADSAAAAASTAQRAADAAQATANEAKAAAGAASTQLAGIGPQETVAGRIKDAGQSVAEALGGGASANADGTVSAPSYGVAAINADGSTGPVTKHGNVGGALTALDQNIGTVNDRVDGLARDSLRWNENLGAYDAAHDGQASSQIANVAAGVNTTDAVNVGQLNTVDQAAKA
ncbi:ESPR-type extended signal peptide-containing protein, partial [Stenotrophomonas geniculata]|nr:ESPR-type extended signal peptide-containing protein [Stenotrophomonas geniculata]